jgi:hypothetical protein
MAESTAGPSPGADAPPASDGEDDAPDWGRLLDAAGIVAGILLLLICADIWSDGRLISRRLHGGGEGGEPAD